MLYLLALVCVSRWGLWFVCISLLRWLLLQLFLLQELILFLSLPLRFLQYLLLVSLYFCPVQKCDPELILHIRNFECRFICLAPAFISLRLFRR